jgi:hypothetical protein
VTQILPNIYSPDFNTLSSVWQLISTLHNTFGVSESHHDCHGNHLFRVVCALVKETILIIEIECFGCKVQAEAEETAKH